MSGCAVYQTVLAFFLLAVTMIYGCACEERNMIGRAVNVTADENAGAGGQTDGCHGKHLL